MEKNLDATDSWGINTETSIKFNLIQELSFGTCLLRTGPYTETLSVCFDSDVTFPSAVTKIWRRRRALEETSQASHC